MPGIENYVEQIRRATYGRDVREAIASGIEECYSDVTQAKTIADDSIAAAEAKAQEAASSAEAAATASQTASAAKDTAVQKAGEASQSATAAAQSVSEVSAVRDSIPADYTELSQSVVDLKSAIDQLSGEIADVTDENKAIENTAFATFSHAMRFQVGRYDANGFNDSANKYARNVKAYPAGTYRIPAYVTGKKVFEYVSDSGGTELTGTWFAGKLEITVSSPFYITFYFGETVTDEDLENLEENFVLTKMNSGTTLESRIETNENAITNLNSYFSARYSKNRFDGAYTTGGYVNPTTGAISHNSGHAYSSWVDLSNRNGANVVISCNKSYMDATSKNFDNLRCAFYDSTETFIPGSGAVAPTMQTDSDRGLYYCSITPPANAAYMLFSNPAIMFADAYEFQIEYASPSAFSPYTGDYIGVKNAELAKAPVIETVTSMTFGEKPDQATADTLVDGETLVVETNSIMKNQCISFFAKISGTFGGVWVGHGLESYGYYIIVDGTNMTYGSNGNTGSSTAHGLTISEFIGVTVEVDVDLNVKTTITSAGGVFTKTQQINSSWRGDVFAKSIGTSFTDAVLTWNCDDYKCPVWAFGDSYFTLYNPTRWTYYIPKTWGFNNVLLNAYPGEASTRAYRDFQNALKHGRPKYLIWCIGMNDTDTDSAPNANWLDKVLKVNTLCTAYGIELILTTIPIVTHASHVNTYKNAWIRESGIRYVDFASALENVTGWVSDDTIHPSEIGGRFMALKLLADVPELLQGK